MYVLHWPEERMMIGRFAGTVYTTICTMLAQGGHLLASSTGVFTRVASLTVSDTRRVKAV